MNKLPVQKRVQILQMLVEGSSMRSTSRVADVSINTVSKLLVEAGTVCAAFHDQKVRAVTSKRIQVDEVWSFCAAKQRSVPTMKKPVAGAGDVWTWSAIDADSKLIVAWLVGGRDGSYARLIMEDLAARLANRVQLTTDGYRVYLDAVEEVFGADVDYAQLVKIYGESPEAEKRYSPAECIGCERKVIEGRPDPKHISTSFSERQHLSMRMCMRRMTRLTNGFSKKWENHCHALALYFTFYNWVRIHKTLRVTPAMQAGLTDKLLSFEDIVSMMDAAAPAPVRPAVYRKRQEKISN